MMEVIIYINGRTIGSANVQHIGGSDSSSEYRVFGRSEPSPVTGHPGGSIKLKVEGHNRVQSAWALVAKIAEEMASRENAVLLPSPSLMEGERGCP